MSPISRREQLAARLRAVRGATFRSGNRFAQELGWQQSRVSRIETGKQLPTQDDVRAWVRAARASDEVLTELLTLLSQASVEYVTFREMFRAGSPADKQTSIAVLEAQATRLGKYQPAMMLGLVQTPAYARELLALHGGPLTAGASEAEVEALIAARIRRQEVLYAPDKQVQLVMGEAALHSRPGSVGTMLGQLDRLISIAGLPSVELGVIPLDAPMPVMPLSGFALFDRDFLVMESLTGEQRTDDPEQVAVYVKAFDLLRKAAATGPDAVTLIQGVAAALRASHQPRGGRARERGPLRKAPGV